MNSLKISISTSIVLFALGATVVWKNHQQLATAQIKKSQLITKLADSGFSIDKAHPKNRARFTKRPPKEKVENTIYLNDPNRSADLMLKITKAMEYDPQSDLNKPNPVDELQGILNQLSLEDWRILLSRLRTNEAFEKAGDNNIVLNHIIGTLFQNSDQPEAGWLLEIASEFPEFFQDNTSGINSIAHTLSRLVEGETDLDSAVKWIRENHLKIPGYIQDTRFVLTFISSLAAKDPARSFELISELAIKDVSGTLEISAYNLKSNEQRMLFLNALRKDHLLVSDGKSRDEIIDDCKVSLAESAVEIGFETGTQWLSSVENKPNDLNSIIECISERTKFTNFEKWAEWIEQNLPSKNVEPGIQNLVSNWTKKDYRQAGEWLVKTREGPTKNAAIRAYAEAIAAYNPATAVQWAERLPLGEPRDQTLKTIYHQWPETDLGGKEAFGKARHFE